MNTFITKENKKSSILYVHNLSVHFSITMTIYKNPIYSKILHTWIKIVEEINTLFKFYFIHPNNNENQNQKQYNTNAHPFSSVSLVFFCTFELLYTMTNIVSSMYNMMFNVVKLLSLGLYKNSHIKKYRVKLK